MSLTCVHSIADAALHRDVTDPWSFCAGCALVPRAQIDQAAALDRTWRRSPLALSGLTKSFENIYANWRNLYTGAMHVETGLYEKRHAACGRAVVLVLGQRQSYRCVGCRGSAVLRSDEIYDGWPLPPPRPVAQTYEELKMQDHWNRTCHIVVQEILSKIDYETPGGRVCYDEWYWPLVVSWCLFIVSAFREGRDKGMGPHWEYMQMYLDMWKAERGEL